MQNEAKKETPATILNILKEVMEHFQVSVQHKPMDCPIIVLGIVAASRKSGVFKRKQ